jgi:hypothetical protein
MDILFASERLLFREFNAGDSSLICELNGDPAVTKFLHEPSVTEDLAKEVLVNIILPPV